MTIYQWKQAVRDGHVLTVFAGDTFTGSVWVTELDPAIKTLNHLLEKHAFALKFETTSARAGANVVLETTKGNKLHGQDELSYTGVSTMKQALIKLYDTPTVSQQDGGTAVGGKVKRHILMHELIHGIGPDNSEHAESGVFIGKLALSVGAVSHGKVQSLDGDDSVPAFVFASSTLEALRVAWPEKIKKK